LVNGDIICFQKAHLVQMNCRYPDIPSFLGYILGLQELQEAKSKVITIKAELMEAEANVAALEAMMNPLSL
ncbi:hypothetical protein MKW94_020364, partial [Papaver nudicaule]|nr:hypothetical protein [Papaver nudicaule]